MTDRVPKVWDLYVFSPLLVMGAALTPSYQLDNDSQTTVSTPDELQTPNSSGLGGFEFHFDEKPVKGPSGPHLFCISTEGTLPHDGSANLDFPLNTSPIIEPLVESVPHRPKTPQTRPFSSLNRAVAELDEGQVRSWSPRQVADWMRDAGFESSVVEKFLTHDISGVVLLDLQFEDLKELDITSFGKRHRVMSSIQHLRNSSMISRENSLSTSPPKRGRIPQESNTGMIRNPSQRRGRLNRQRSHDDIISPAESVSIVAIEQLLPKPHKCSKGEDCAKWKKQQRKLQRLQEEFCVEQSAEGPKLTPGDLDDLDDHDAHQNEDVRPTSDAEPSVVASSDVLGPGNLPHFDITPEKLSKIAPRDPQENVQQFLSFQHLHSTSPVNAPSPPPANSASYAASPPRKPALALADHLRHLPKLTIPVQTPEQLGPYTPVDGHHPQTPSTIRRRTKTPISAIRHTPQVQLQVAQLQSDPYHYGGVASPADLYRTESPYSTTDIPITSFPVDPLARDVSQSVPPEMRYGAAPPTTFADPIARPSSSQAGARRHRRQNSFTPSIAPLPESTSIAPQPTVQHRPEPPVAPLKLEDVQHAGRMRKRKTTKLLRHEWQDHHFTLRGTRLAMHRDETATSKTLEIIEVDDFAIACSSLASSSKLSAAFKRSILGNKSPSDKELSESAFAFSLVPQVENRNLFASSKSHHFSVRTRDERIDWMRELMLAKALKRGKETGNEIRVNGHLI
jgi:SAM domain (Sterile alpha motif)